VTIPSSARARTIGLRCHQLRRRYAAWPCQHVYARCRTRDPIARLWIPLVPRPNQLRERSNMTDNPFVARISEGSPERRGPRTIDFDECRDALDTPFCEGLFDLLHEPVARLLGV